MTVGELREKLAKYDRDALVLTRGYEGGFVAGEPHDEEFFAYRKESAWYYGDWWEAEDADDPKGRRALLID